MKAVLAVKYPTFRTCQAPWYVKSIDFYGDSKRLDIEVDFKSGCREQIKDVSCDMSPAFIKGVKEQLPQAQA